MARHYISHGIRHRARDLVTRELGPEQPFERAVKLASEIQAERFTSLDVGIVKDANNNVLVVPADPAMPIGSARPYGSPGCGILRRWVWPRSRRPASGISTTICRPSCAVSASKATSWSPCIRSCANTARIGPRVTSRSSRAVKGSSQVIGRVVEVGIADEMTDRKFIVVDGCRRTPALRRIGQGLGLHPPDPGMIVALTSAGGKLSRRTARVETLSLWDGRSPAGSRIADVARHGIRTEQDCQPWPSAILAPNCPPRSALAPTG